MACPAARACAAGDWMVTFTRPTVLDWAASTLHLIELSAYTDRRTEERRRQLLVH